MLRVKRALIVGGGIASMSAAIALREAGVDVHLIDSDPDWKVRAVEEGLLELKRPY